MKKYSVIAAVFALSFIGCAKVSTAPNTQATATNTGTTSNVTSAGSVLRSSSQDGTLDQGTRVPKCFTITNTEEARGFVEYKFSYTDCQGIVQTMSLEFGQSISFSCFIPKVSTNFSYFLIEGGGNCGPR